MTSYPEHFSAINEKAKMSAIKSVLTNLHIDYFGNEYFFILLNLVHVI